LNLDDCNPDTESRFKQSLPAFIAAVSRAGTKFDIQDCRNKSLNKIVADEIERTRIPVNNFVIMESLDFCRLMVLAE
jgi:hypothetical protein